MKTVLSVLCLCLILGGCSAYRAASNEGVAVTDIKDCKNRACLLSRGMELVQSKETGGSVVEVYRAVARKSGGSYFRAAGHGLLSVATLGLWEIAGTPIEGALSNNRGFVVAQARYGGKNSENIVAMTIYDADGSKAIEVGDDKK